MKHLLAALGELHYWFMLVLAVGIFSFGYVLSLDRLYLPVVVNPTALTTTSTTLCTEDMPCWDCETMGNHICGTRP